MANKILIPKETESIVKNGLALLRLSRFFGFIKSLLDDHRLEVFVLTDGANIATDCSEGSVFTVTLGGNRTLDNPTNKVIGKTYTWIITQDGTGGRTLAFGTDFVFTGSSTIRPEANKVTIIEGRVLSPTVIQTTIVNAPGRVIQTVQEHVTVTSSQALTAGVRANITNLNKSITPTDDDSKILIHIKWSGEGSSTSNQDTVFGIKRDSTDIGNPTSASARHTGIAIIQQGYWDSNADSTSDSCSYEYLDSPSSSSSLTYYATILHTITQTLYNNRTVGDSDNSARERLTSTITLMEISG